jgi:hypothetical protein
MMIVFLLVATINIDMYQDRSDKNKTIVIIETDSVVETHSVKTNELEKYFNLKDNNEKENK